MNQTEVDTALALFEDMNYSAHPALRDLGRGTMLAAIHLLRNKDVQMTSDNLKRAVLAFYGYLMDENTFACSEDQQFMDMCDERFGNSAFLLDEVSKKIADNKIREFHERGWYVVKLRSKHAGVGENDEGYYVFTGEAIVK